MAKVKVLIEGYAKEIADGWLASSTVTLVKANGKNLIVDPGCNREKLISALSKNGLQVEDIDFVFLTHNHTDHILLTGMFENAKVLNDTEIYDGDKQVDHNGIVPEMDLEIIEVPGHDQFHCALVVPTQEGVYVIAGDVFWWKDDEKKDHSRETLLSHPDPYVKDEKVLRASREKILDLADFVIPGHGPMFKAKS